MAAAAAGGRASSGSAAAPAQQQPSTGTKHQAPSSASGSSTQQHAEAGASRAQGSCAWRRRTCLQGSLCVLAAGPRLLTLWEPAPKAASAGVWLSARGLTVHGSLSVSIHTHTHTHMSTPTCRTRIQLLARHALARLPDARGCAQRAVHVPSPCAAAYVSSTLQCVRIYVRVQGRRAGARNTACPPGPYTHAPGLPYPALPWPALARAALSWSLLLLLLLSPLHCTQTDSSSPLLSSPLVVVVAGQHHHQAGVRPGQLALPCAHQIFRRHQTRTRLHALALALVTLHRV